MTQNAGLSIQDAFEQALAEEDLSESSSETPDSVLADEAQPTSDGEQPNVESQESQGLFTDLSDDTNNDEGDQPDLRESLHQVKVRGETKEVTYDELINGYQRQEDYTIGKQELSDLRREAEDALTLMKALQENPVPTIRRLWDAASQGQSINPSGQDNSPRGLPEQKKETDHVDIDAIVQQKLEEALANDPRIQAIEDQRFLEEIDAIFSHIAKEWGLDEISDEDKNAVLDEAQKTGNPDLEAVFAKMMHKKMLRDKEHDNVLANSTSTGYGSSGPAIASVPKEPKRFSSFREAMNDTLAEENIDSETLGRVISNL